MSFMHYISANKELPLGVRGKKKPKQIGMSLEELKKTKACMPIETLIEKGILIPEKVKVYDSLDDLGIIKIDNIKDVNEVVKKHFKNKFVYKFYGSFHLSEKLKNHSLEYYNRHKKCLEELFKYIKENISDGEEFEIYTCWADEESEERNMELDKVIDLKNFIIPESFDFVEREYMVIKG